MPEEKKPYTESEALEEAEQVRKQARREVVKDIGFTDGDVDTFAGDVKDKDITPDHYKRTQEEVELSDLSVLDIASFLALEKRYRASQAELAAKEQTETRLMRLSVLRDNSEGYEQMVRVIIDEMQSKIKKGAVDKELFLEYLRSGDFARSMRKQSKREVLDKRQIIQVVNQELKQKIDAFIENNLNTVQELLKEGIDDKSKFASLDEVKSAS